MHAANEVITSVSASDLQLERARATMQESLDWVMSQREPLVGVMAPYLHFGDVPLDAVRPR